MNFLARILNRAAIAASGGSAQRAFEAGTPSGRRWADQGFGAVNSEVAVSGRAIRRRARAMMANNPHAAAAVNAYAVALTGSGITPTPQHSDPATRADMLALWNAWAPVADISGGQSFQADLATIARAIVVDGEALVRLVMTSAGLRLQLIPAELLAEESRDLPGGGYIASGVEHDPAGRIVAYHLHRTNPVSPFESLAAPLRVPADDVLHVFRPLLPGQARGVSWLAPVLLRLRELDQLSDALLVGAKIGAMFAGFIVDQNSTGPNPFTTGDGKQNGATWEASLEPGVMRVLPSGVDVKFATPQQAQQTAEFVRHQLRSIAAGIGLPEHLISADLTGASYGSLRAGMIAFRQTVEAVQHNIIVPLLLQPIWNRLVSLAVLRGELDAPGFDDDPAPWFAVEWLPPRAPWLDPLKDAEAEAMMIAHGLKSRRQAVAELGYDVEALDAETAADRERERRLGLDFSQGSNFRKPAPAEDTSNAA